MTTLSRLDYGDTLHPGTPDIPAVPGGIVVSYVKDPHWEVVPGSNPVSLRYVYWRRVETPYPPTPAIPGLPAVYSRNPPDGWDAYAHSAESMPQGDHRATFSMPVDAPAAVVGLVPVPGAPLGDLFEHGFFFDGGRVWGANWQRPGATPLLGTFTDATVFAIEVKDAEMRLRADSTVLQTLPYPYPATGSRFLAAALYAKGAQVRNAQFAPMPAPSGVRVTLDALTLSSRSPLLTGADARLSALTMTARPATPAPEEVSGMRADLGALVMNRPGAGMAATLDALTLTAHALPTPTRSGMRDARVGPLILTAGAPVVIDPGEPVNPEPVPAEPVLERLGMAVVLDIDLDAADGVPLARLPAVVVVDIPLTEAVAVPVEVLPAAFRVAVAMLAHDPSPARLDVAVAVDIPLIEVGADIDTWAVNVATSGSTRYVGFPFNSLARIGNRYYGAGNLGVCELRGHTDAGADIDALIDLGDKDFGTPQRKTLVEAFVSMAGTAPLLMELHAEGASFTYATDGAGPHLKEQRVKFGKGRALQTTFINPVIRNQRGADFQIDALQFEVQTLSRKL
jgi:hypothetical protein